MSQAIVDKTLRDKLAKLLTLKNNASSEGEAAAAAAGIHRLLFQHNMAMADCEIESFVRVEAYESELFDIGTPSPSSYGWKSRLLASIARNNFCKTVNNLDFRRDKNGNPVINRAYFPKKGYREKVAYKPSGKMYIIGEPDNIYAVKLTYSYLVEEIRHLTRNAWKVAGLTKAQEPLWKKSFRLGVIGTIEARMREQRRLDLELIDNSNALVVIKDKDLNDATRRLLGEVTPGQSRSSKINGMAYRGGEMLGNSLQLNKEMPARRTALNK